MSCRVRHVNSRHCQLPAHTRWQHADPACRLAVAATAVLPGLHSRRSCQGMWLHHRSRPSNLLRPGGLPVVLAQRLGVQQPGRQLSILPPTAAQLRAPCHLDTMFSTKTRRRCQWACRPWHPAPAAFRASHSASWRATWTTHAAPWSSRLAWMRPSGPATACWSRATLGSAHSSAA